MLRILAAILMALSALPLFADPVADARARCDSLPLAPVEGLYLFPDDQVTVSILRNPDLNRFDITVLDAFDLSLPQGAVIGWLSESPDPLRFKMHLFSNCRNGRLSAPKSCMAILNSRSESLQIKSDGPKLSLRLNPSSILPGFLKILRLSISLPDSSLPEGLIRIYPTYDGNPSTSRRKPIYL